MCPGCPGSQTSEVNARTERHAFVCGFCDVQAGTATITDWRGEREKVGERLDAHGDVEQTGGCHVDGGRRTFFSLGVAALVLKE